MKKMYILIKDDPEHPEFNGLVFLATGETDSFYIIEYGELSLSVKKEYCTRYGPSEEL